MSHFSSSNGYSKRRTSQAGGIFYKTMALFMCSRADRGQHGGGSRCGIDTKHCFNTVAAAAAGRYFRRLSFRRQRPIPHSSICARAEKNLYRISADSLYGIADLKTGKMIVPAEYTTIDVLSDGRFLLTRYENQASSFYYADANGTVTPIQTPVKGTYFSMAGDDCFFIGVYAKRPLTAAVQQPAEQYDIPTLVLLDENMKVIRDDIDGACGAASTPHFTNGLMPIQTGSTLWIGSRKGAIGNGTYGLIDKTGQFVGRNGFDELSWTDSRYIGKRGTALYQLDGKSGEIRLPANASQESSWAKAELEAAREHDISLSFYYPRLNITRVDFCRLAVKLYQKVQPNASAAPAAAFSDCENESVCLAAALGIVTGYDDGTFRPYQSITRQQAAAMLDRLYTTLGGKASATNDKPYADDAQLGDWARSSVYAMREIGIMQGKENNRFRPKDGYTQEQAVVTVERAFQAVK